MSGKDWAPLSLKSLNAVNLRWLVAGWDKTWAAPPCTGQSRRITELLPAIEPTEHMTPDSTVEVHYEATAVAKPQ
jgi:hypothetical protein